MREMAQSAWSVKRFGFDENMHQKETPLSVRYNLTKEVFQMM